MSTRQVRQIMADKRIVIARTVGWTTRGLVAVVLVGAGIIAIIVLNRTRPTPEAAADAAAAPPVIVMQARPQPVARRWQGYGTARAQDSADVPARVTATVVNIPSDVLEGEPVEQGELLVQLDDSDFARQVEIAQQNIADLNAQLERLDAERDGLEQRLELAEQAIELAEAEFDRISSAFERGVAKQREVDQARQALINATRERVLLEESRRQLQPRQSSIRAQLAGQRASLRLAQQNVDRASIEAPIAGVLQEVDVEVGEIVTAGQRVARIVNLDLIEVPIMLPASARSEITIGDPVELEPVAAPERTWQAPIARIAPEDDAARRTVMIYVLLNNADPLNPRIAPGQFVRGTVVSSGDELRSVVPRRAMLDDRVLVVRDRVVAAQPVDADFHIEQRFPALGLPDTQWVVLADRLPADALVVADVGRSLRIGSRVDPVRAGSSGVAARLEATDEGAAP